MARKQKTEKKRLRWMVVGGALVAALLGGWCGRGYLGGGDSGDERTTDSKQPVAKGAAAAVMDAGPAPRCRVRVDKEGIHLGAKVLAVAEAVKACSASKEAELVVTGDAKYGTVDELKKALGEAGIRIFSAGAP